MGSSPTEGVGMRDRSSGLRDFSDLHGRALRLLNAHIERAVPRAYSLCEAFASPRDVAGSTLGAIFREFLIQSCGEEPQDSWGQLAFTVGQNRSLVFTDPVGRDVRVRKLPVDWRSRREVALPMWEEPTLFSPPGNLASAPIVNHQLVILWRPHPDRAGLDRAVLASVQELSELGATRVVDFVPLAKASSSSPTPADFEDFFGSVAGLIGPEP